jgi:hypothetical protein
MFFQFIGIPSGLESNAVEYFNEMYLSSSGRKFETVTYQAIDSYKKEILEDKNGAYKDFIKRIKQHFYNVVPLQKAVDF